MTKTIAQIFDEAAANVADGWCQGVLARNSSGGSVGASSAAAERWCVSGAIERACVSREGIRTGNMQAALAVFRVLECLGIGGISSWNDRPGTTQAEAFWSLLAARDAVIGTTL